MKQLVISPFLILVCLLFPTISQAHGSDPLDHFFFASLYKCQNMACKVLSPTAFSTELAVILSTVGPIQTTIDDYLSSQDKKIVLQAKEDAAYYVATEGLKQGAYVTIALKTLRQYDLFKRLDDRQLVTMILMIN